MVISEQDLGSAGNGIAFSPDFKKVYIVARGGVVVSNVTADNKMKTYGDANPALTATVTGTVNGDTLDYTLATAAMQFSGVGDYDITVTLGSNPNYDVTPHNGNLHINAKAASVTAAVPWMSSLNVQSRSRKRRSCVRAFSLRKSSHCSTARGYTRVTASTNRSMNS